MRLTGGEVPGTGSAYGATYALQLDGRGPIFSVRMDTSQSAAHVGGQAFEVEGEWFTTWEEVEKYIIGRRS